jgi:hypothetical protein
VKPPDSERLRADTRKTPLQRGKASGQGKAWCSPGRLEHTTHEPLISRAILAEVPLAGLSFSAAAKQSDYEITAVADPESLLSVLSRALGVPQTVVKTRVLYLVGQTRVHLDSVDGLGDFLELEVVLRPGQDMAQGQAIAADLMDRLGIRDEDLCSTAYADMLSALAAD